MPLRPLLTTQGQTLEIIDPGLHNRNAGPDFLNARIKIGDTLWVGSVELHTRSSDWQRHRHHLDPAYNNVILHVAEQIDAPVLTEAGQELPQLQLDVPEYVRDNYRQLTQAPGYPPCAHILPRVSGLTCHSWLSALTTERLEQKTQRISQWLHHTTGDWERVCFISLARSFGFGTNADTFEEWATGFPLHDAGKHRDNPFQIEALFFGQAGLLDPDAMSEKRRREALADDYFNRLREEYRFLAHKFSLTPIDGRRWKYMRMRPQNAPHIRLAQLMDIYLQDTASFSQLMAAGTVEEMRQCLSASTHGYWLTHYHFGAATKPVSKRLRPETINLLLINALAPLLFAYGRYRLNEKLCERAFNLLEQLPPESNHVVKAWHEGGLKAQNAADSQALLQLQQAYCQPKDCLRCRFGYEYLRHPKP